MTIRLLILLVSGSLLSGCAGNEKKKSIAEKDLIPYSILKAFPHDVTAFTQGLTIYDGRLFESTGQANSWIAEVDIASGLQDKKVILDKKYFGEGITILNNKLYQLTWKNHTGFVYDIRTFRKLREFQYAHEGWGITHNDTNLIVSDGTHRLYLLDTATLLAVDTLKVSDDGGEVDQLNELEYIDGYVFANQWQTNYIFKIDPASGKVVGKMDLTPVAERMIQINRQADVLNGIAYEKKSKVLLVTGKLWPSLFALKFKSPDSTRVESPN
jgi:glutaminyl-peptide cyclotransferase